MYYYRVILVPFGKSSVCLENRMWETDKKLEKPIKTPKNHVGNAIFGGKRINSEIATNTGEIQQ